MAAPLTYQQYLNTYGIQDTPASKAKYNILQAKNDPILAPRPAQTASPTSSYGSSMQTVPPISTSGAPLTPNFPSRATLSAAFSPTVNTTSPAPAPTSAPLPADLSRLNPLTQKASTALGAPVESFAEWADRTGTPMGPAAAKKYNEYMRAAALAAPASAAPVVSGQVQSPDRSPQGSTQPAAPVAQPVPIASTPIQPVNTPGPAPVITPDATPAPTPKADDTAKNLAKIAATAMGGLGDAFSARAAALAGRSFTPEQTMQNKQLEFQGGQNAADRAQTMQLQAKNAALQTNIAQLQSKTQLTEADKNNLAAMQRQQAQIAAQLRQAIIERGGLPGADSLGIR